MTDVHSPDALGDAGRAFWDEMTAELEFDGRDRRVLVEAARTVDIIEALAAEVDDHGVMATGSMGQKTVNPAVPELRAQQASFVKLIASLDLPEDKERDDLWRHKRAKAGAAARHGLHAVQGGGA